MKHKAFYLILLSLGIGIGLITVVGAYQLYLFASPEYSGNRDELIVVRPIWDFFAPKTGTVVVSRVATKVQTFLLVLGLFAICLVTISLIVLLRGSIGRSHPHDEQIA